MSVALYLPNMSGGGVERVYLLLMREFLARNFLVTLLVQNRQGALIGEVPAEVEIIAFGTRRTLYDTPHLIRFFRRTPPDIFISSLNHNNLTALFARTATRCRSRVFICQHNALSSEVREHKGWKYGILPLLYRVLTPAAAGIIAVSEGVATDLVALSGLRRERISVIYNPIIDEKFGDRAEGPAPHPWFEDRTIPVFVAAGRLTPQKDFDTLIRAFALLKRGREARLIVLGIGPLRDTLQRLAETLGVAEAVAFLGFQRNPLPYFRHASAFVLSSAFEGFGNVIVEALGCGTPVIATDCPFGPSEILENGKYGCLVPVKNPEALAAAMQSNLRARWPAEVLRARAARFSAAVAGEEYVRLFSKSLVDDSGRDGLLGPLLQDPAATKDAVAAIDHPGLTGGHA